MKNFWKGFIIGIGKIIPGVSGAMLAIAMGVYDKAIDYIINFRNKKKESIKYLFPLGMGIILSIIFFSRIISFSLNKYYVTTMLFFVGLIIGGIPSLIKRVKKENYWYTVITFVFFFLVAVTNINNTYICKSGIMDYVMFFISGVMEAIGTVVPGVSGTALLMIMGTYNLIISAIGNLNNIKILIPFIMGLGIGLILIIKIINYLLKKNEEKVYASVLGILLSSIVLLIMQSFKYRVSLGSLGLGFIFLIMGIFIANMLGEKK